MLFYHSKFYHFALHPNRLAFLGYWQLYRLRISQASCGIMFEKLAII